MWLKTEGHLVDMPFGIQTVKFDNGSKVAFPRLQQDKSTTSLIDQFLTMTNTKIGGRSLRRLLKKLKPRKNKALTCQDNYKVSDDERGLQISYLQ